MNPNWSAEVVAELVTTCHSLSQLSQLVTACHIWLWM